MTTSIVLFNRDLRVHDHPALAQAVRQSERVVPLFVLDDRITKAEHTSPNRLQLLVNALHDLRASLRSLDGDLIVRRGDLPTEVMRIAQDTDASVLWSSEDVSPFARRRESSLREACRVAGLELRLTPGVTIVAPNELQTSTGTPYRVFTPYWRSWSAAPRREVEPVPQHVPLGDGIDPGEIPDPDVLSPGPRSLRLPRGGEAAARAQLSALLSQPPADDDSIEGSSRLGMAIHFGCLSPREVEATLQSEPGYVELLRSLCWRDFYHQFTANQPNTTTSDFRPRGIPWRRDIELERAWKEGVTGYPFVDAAMRQLRQEGWMHNRLRLVVASILTKHMGIDWRVGAAHFNRWLVDGDVANNTANWQWVAGTGTDSRPNRILNPVRQARRFDPRGDYVRRYVSELASLSVGQIHEPWLLDPTHLSQLGYPERVLDHEAAAAAFREGVRSAKV
ncbi:MAG: deoxyribodipyrimidine photo-lyase [Chloroflexi bacterium]|nr:deoxyribodipyrimidine photo-lyase [Chloroflexota bacterium]MDA1147346.1 deoxyribodipyrimidine photo-lyase [Chloroflexota bacterium]